MPRLAINFLGASLDCQDQCDLSLNLVAVFLFFSLSLSVIKSTRLPTCSSGYRQENRRHALLTRPATRAERRGNVHYYTYGTKSMFRCPNTGKASKVLLGLERRQLRQSTKNPIVGLVRSSGNDLTPHSVPERARGLIAACRPRSSKCNHQPL